MVIRENVCRSIDTRERAPRQRKMASVYKGCFHCGPTEEELNCSSKELKDATKVSFRPIWMNLCGAKGTSMQNHFVAQ